MLTAAEIKAWLVATGRTYEWYAEQLGVSKGTVAQWLMTKSPTPIPEIAQRLTARLMQPEPPEGTVTTLSEYEITLLQQLASEEGLGLIDYCVKLLREYLAKRED